MHFDSALTDVNDDKLGRKEFAVQIANGLVKSFANNHESIVIGINGEWGSGKSTLVNFVVQEIDNLTKDDGENKPVIIRFNPWMFSGQKELQTIFLKEMYLVIKRDLGFFKKHAKNAAPLLDSLELLINATVFIKNPALVGASSRITSFFKNAVNNINKVEDIHKLKENIDKSIIATGLKIYITVDDIDRLSPTEITEILQMVKLNANFANTVFLLCYDYDVVVSALKNKFGENGEKYLEKIVQIDYTLPHISKDKIKELFVEEIGKLFENEELNKELKVFTEKDELILPFFSTLRDMYRFLNAIKLRLEFIYEEVNVGDFLLIETLRIFDKKAYRLILSNKNILTKPDFEHTKYDNVIQLLHEIKYNMFIMNIIDHCFYLKTVFTKSSDIIDISPILEQKRTRSIGHEYYFERYFTLQINDKKIVEEDFKVFMADPINMKIKILEKWYRKEALSDFFSVYKKRIILSVESENNIDILESILLFVDKKLEYIRTDSLYESYYSILLIEYFMILKEVSYKTAKLFLDEKLFNKTVNYFVYFLELSKIIEGYDRYKEEKDSSYKFIYINQSDEENNELVLKSKVRANEICKDIINDFDLNNNTSRDKIQRIIVYVLIYKQKDVINSILNSFYKNEYNFLFIINCIVRLSYYYTTFYGSMKWGYRFLKDDFNWLNIKKAVKYANEIDISKIESEELKNALKLFLKMDEDGFDANIYYDFDTQENITDIFNK